LLNAADRYKFPGLHDTCRRMQVEDMAQKSRRADKLPGLEYLDKTPMP